MSIVLPGLEVQDITKGTGISARRSVAAASTANVADLTTLAQNLTLDGYTLQAGNRILLKNQTTGTENGVYIVQVSGAPIRAEDYSDGTAVGNTFLTVQHGTVNDDTVWLCKNDPGSDIVGTNALSFVFFGGDNIATLTGLATAGGLLSFAAQDINGNTAYEESPTNTKPQSRWVTFNNPANATPLEITPTVTLDYIVTYTSRFEFSSNGRYCEMGLFYVDNYTVASKTAANPMVVTTTAAHGFTAGEDVYLTGLSGVTDGRYLTTAVTATTVTVTYNNSGGNTTGGGTIGQPKLVTNTNDIVGGNSSAYTITISQSIELTANVLYMLQLRLSSSSNNNATVDMYNSYLRAVTTTSS